jgi:hypothetical protein
MTHGRDAEEAAERVERIRETIDAHGGARDDAILRSTEILKKTGIRLAERADARTEADAEA